MLYKKNISNSYSIKKFFFFFIIKKYNEFNNELNFKIILFNFNKLNLVFS